MIESELDLEGDEDRRAEKRMDGTEIYQWAGSPDKSKKVNRWGI